MARRWRGEKMPYPTSRDVPVHPALLNLPEAVLPDRDYNRNNHHMNYYESMFKSALVLITLRNCDGMQWQAPINQHNWIHLTFGPPEVTKEGAYRYVHEAYERNERLRFGSAHRPKYREIGKDLLRRIEIEKKQLGY